MKPKIKFFLFFLITTIFVLVMYWLVKDVNWQILNPAGEIAAKQKKLIVFTTVLSLFVVVPVFILTFYIAWKYRAGNKQAKYEPEWESNRFYEFVWWAIPIAIITVLAVITWQTSHSLDPYQALASNKRPLRVQVVALEWRWLFIYPDNNVASLNELNIPTDRPIEFSITADAPMNSFWIPQLGGQIYAMSGMNTELNLAADKTGTFKGYSANLSGEGFAGMSFNVNAKSQADFDMWLNNAQNSPNSLDFYSYMNVARPNKSGLVETYVLKDANLYSKIIMKYMTPTFREAPKNEEFKLENLMKTHQGGEHK